MRIKNNKIIVLASLLLLICVFSVGLGGCESNSSYNKELLTGTEDASSMFDYATLSEMSKDWSLESGGLNSSVFSVGSNGVTINTTNSGFAEMSQHLILKTYSYYKVEYEFTISQMTTFDDDTDYYPGLFIGFLEDPNFNVVGDKKAQETFVQDNGTRTFYFKTSGTNEYNLSINVGTSTFPTKAIARVKNVSLSRVTSKDALAAEKNGFDIFELRPSVYGRHNQTNILYVILGAIAVPLLVYIAYVLISRHLSNPNNMIIDSKKNFWSKLTQSKYLGILSVVGITLLVRFIILLIETLVANQSRIVETYFGYSLELLSAQGTWLSKYGMAQFYKYNTNSTFLPIPLYLSTLAGLIGQVVQKIPGISADSVALSVITMNKVLTVLADVGSVIFIYKLIEKHQGKTIAIVTSSLYSLLPISFAMSASWGSVQSVATLLIIATFYCILNKNYIGMSISFFLACLTSTFSLFLTPFVIFYTIIRIIDSVKNKKYKELIAPIVCFVSGFILFYLLTLPFSINEIAKGDAFVAFTRFFSLIKGADIYTANAFNFQAMLKNNFVSITTQSKVVDIIFIVFILLVFATVYFKTKNRLNLTLLGAGFLLVLWTLSNNMQPEFLLLALPLLLIVATLIKDVRLYIAFALYSAFAFVNNAYLFMVAGYTSNGVAQIGYDGNAILYVFGAISLALAIYLIIIGYDILVNKKVLLVKPMDEKYSVHISRVAKNAATSISRVAVISASWVREFFITLAADIKELREKNRNNRIKRRELKEQSDTESDDNIGDIDQSDE